MDKMLCLSKGFCVNVHNQWQKCDIELSRGLHLDEVNLSVQNGSYSRQRLKHIHDRLNRFYLCHGIINLFQLLVVVSGVPQRLNHDLLNLREKLFEKTADKGLSSCSRKRHVQVKPTFMTVSNMGMSTNLMKPIWAVGLVTLSLSMKGATGRPSDFSRSLWEKQMLACIIFLKCIFACLTLITHCLRTVLLDCI